MDLNHGLAFAGSSMKIYAGEYKDCQDADLVVIAAGVDPETGGDPPGSFKEKYQVFRSVIEPVTASGFNGIFLVATNPVDIMTRITCTLSGLIPPGFGKRYCPGYSKTPISLGEFYRLIPEIIHAYVMGEHGDSEFVPWSQALLAPAHTGTVRENGEAVCRQRFDEIEEEVRTALTKS